MNAQELRDKGTEERGKLLLELRKKERELRFSIAGREIRNHRELRVVRKDVARLLTIEREDALNA
ncbi:MAG: 50S ribosomal protein L29 [Candidatus Moranbacteria bacterium]|nr:50S ribosomal protein L29 [Candidatus Moranbacteria bacterium]